MTNVELYDRVNKLSNRKCLRGTVEDIGYIEIFISSGQDLVAQVRARQSSKPGSLGIVKYDVS